MSAVPAYAGAQMAPVTALPDFCLGVLAGAGANPANADAATRAMMHGSRLGVDSHGVRLLDHYVQALTGGRVRGDAVPRVAHRFGAIATVDGGHAHGALAAYAAMEEAADLARRHGIGAVSVHNTTHFGPAGAFAVAAAAEGLIGFSSCNSDSFVRLHDGAARFHGTNPMAFAVPVAGGKPWLLDMATSAITYNKVQLHKSLNATLPDAVASDGGGIDTSDPALSAMLAPLGGAFGFKGAGLAGMIEVLSSVLAGMRLSHEILPMSGPDFSTAREMGAFVLAINPDAFLDRAAFDDGMARYLSALRGSAVRDGATVMAPGDREWAEEARRLADGVPIDPATADAFRRLSETYGVPLPYATYGDG